MTVQLAVIVNSINGLSLDWTSISSITINTGQCADDTYRSIIDVPSSLLVSIASSGINGLDTGVEAADTWYSVWVVSGASGVGGLLSLSSTAPTLPAGYDAQKRRVGWIRNETTDIRFFHQQVWGSSRLYLWDESDRVGNEIASGLVNTTMVAVSAAAWLPPTCTTGYFNLEGFINDTATFQFAYMNRNGNAQATPNSRAVADTSNIGSADVNTLASLAGTDSSQQVQARVATAAGSGAYTINVLGFLDQLEID